MSFEEIFDDSYKRILSIKKNGKNFFESFYDLFLSGDEEIAKRFANTDMDLQQSMLKKSRPGSKGAPHQNNYDRLDQKPCGPFSLLLRHCQTILRRYQCEKSFAFVSRFFVNENGHFNQ